MFGKTVKYVLEELKYLEYPKKEFFQSTFIFFSIFHVSTRVFIIDYMVIYWDKNEYWNTSLIRVPSY